MAVVEGRLQNRDWQDRDGNKRRSTEIVADNVYFGDSKRDGDGFPQQQGYGGYSGYGGQPGGYTPQAAGYGGPPPGGYPASDFTELDEDDGELPF